jgi:hypothetical protein
MPTLITELLGRADAGVSVTPFICRTEDDRKVYVKPSGTHPESLIHEWIGGRLAHQMSLPAAEIDIIEVPLELAEANTRVDWSDFKAGIGFGSYFVGPEYRDLQASDLSHLGAELLADVLLFDYWIQNQDRRMGPIGGNPNTMVHYDRNEFYLIDHDNAFDSSFDMTLYNQLHIGRNQREYWLLADRRDAWSKKVETCLEHLDDFWQELPEEWLYSELDSGSEPRYSLSPIRELLQKPLINSDTFWTPILS